MLLPACYFSNFWRWVLFTKACRYTIYYRWSSVNYVNWDQNLLLNNSFEAQCHMTVLLKWWLLWHFWMLSLSKSCNVIKHDITWPPFATFCQLLTLTLLVSSWQRKSQMAIAWPWGIYFWNFVNQFCTHSFKTFHF